MALAALAAAAAARRTSEDRRHDADAPAEVAEASERVGARVATAPVRRTVAAAPERVQGMGARALAREAWHLSRSSLAPAAFSFSLSPVQSVLL